MADTPSGQASHLALQICPALHPTLESAMFKGVLQGPNECVMPWQLDPASLLHFCPPQDVLAPEVELLNSEYQTLLYGGLSSATLSEDRQFQVPAPQGLFTQKAVKGVLQSGKAGQWGPQRWWEPQVSVSLSLPLRHSCNDQDAGRALGLDKALLKSSEGLGEEFQVHQLCTRILCWQSIFAPGQDPPTYCTTVKSVHVWSEDLGLSQKTVPLNWENVMGTSQRTVNNNVCGFS